VNVIFDAASVEITDHRWYADIRINRPDGTATNIRVCAEVTHSGLWLGDPNDHEEH